LVNARDGVVLDDAMRQAITSRREELLNYLRRQPAAKLAKAPAGIRVPATPAQTQFLFGALLDGSAEVYRLNSAFRLAGPLDHAALAAALRDTVAQFDAFRMRFVEDGGQVWLEDSNWQPELPAQPYAGAEADLLAELAATHAPFDLYNGPHLAAHLYQLAPDHHVLFLSVQHRACDGGSIGLVADALAGHYAARRGAQAPPVPTPFSFRDFAHWTALRDAALRDGAAQAFWRAELAAAPPTSTVQADVARSWQRQTKARATALETDAGLSDRLASAGKRVGASPFQLILSAYALALQRHCGQESVVVGVPWRNRSAPGSELVVGPLLNVLPIHLRVAQCRTVGDLVRETMARLGAAIDHGDTSLLDIVDAVKPERSAAFSPLFQALCSFEPTELSTTSVAGVRFDPIDLADETGRYDLALVLRRSRDGLTGTLKSDRALYREDTAGRLAGHILKAIDFVTGSPDRTLDELELATTDEAEELARFSQGPHRDDYPVDVPLVDHFAATARKFPDRIAVEQAGRRLSYAELDRLTTTLAATLCPPVTGIDCIVGINIARSLEFVVAVLTVMKANCGYLPLDPGLPAQRREFMLAQCDARAVITAVDVVAERMTVELLGGGFPAARSGADVEKARRHSASYVIYTSGSTGEPKGVLTDSRAIVNNLVWMNDHWPLSGDDALLFKSSIGFDVSVKEIFWPLIAGARLVVAEPFAEHDPQTLRKLIVDHRITVIHLVPTMLEFFLSGASGDGIAHLRIVMCGGEKVTPQLRERFHAVSAATLLHLYGPTEAAIAVTGVGIGQGDRMRGETIPLGTPMPNCSLYVLGPTFERLPVGVPGELFIGGLPLARCYVGDPRLTAERFLPDPHANRSGARMYRTGDRARWGADGQVQFLGRVDRQIKLRGLRIEPGEIEARLRDCDGVTDAFVTLQGEDRGAILVAYVVMGDGRGSTDHLHASLLRTLPSYMVPARIVALSAFPVNANGKTDIAALPSMAELPATPGREPPTGDVETAIGAIWEELLQTDDIGRDENFFELGGNSLLLVQMREALQRLMSCEVALPVLFQYPTIRHLAGYLEQQPNGDRTSWAKRAVEIGKGWLSSSGAAR
jgi:amino acid adenylation domain-containing protein